MELGGERLDLDGKRYHDSTWLSLFVWPLFYGRL